MADVTGRAYEAFVELLLRLLRFRDEWTEGKGADYLYERHPEAHCHVSKNICPHAADCDAFSNANRIPYGPWYDPDFFLLDGMKPLAALHVTHWSNPSSSQYKFWRTIEDHFQYKVHFGREFLSINFVFLALDVGEEPRFVTDSQELLSLHGWKPATGSVLAVSFDSSMLFPLDYAPIETFVTALPPKIPGNSRKKRELLNNLWETLYAKNVVVRRHVNEAAKLLRKALTNPPSPRYTGAAITRLQDVCWKGRQRSVGLHTTATRYRKGIQHAFIIRELVARALSGKVDPDAALWSILKRRTPLSVETLPSTAWSRQRSHRHRVGRIAT